MFTAPWRHLSPNTEETRPRATCNGVTLAESDSCEIVDGNQYFPPDSVNRTRIVASDTTTVCPWKGTASYYSVEVGDETNKDAVQSYPSTKEAIKNIEGFFAFWNGVTVEP